MPNQDLTEIAVVLDRSGSMASIRADMVGGFDTFVADQRKEPGSCVVSLYQFDDKYDVVFEEVAIAEVPSLPLQPRGSTALLDALGRTITAVGERLARKSEAERPGKVILVVITDGHENASTEFTRDQIRKMVTHQTDTYDWQFAFLGANLDSFSEAQSLGYTNASAVMDFHASGAGVKLMSEKFSKGVSNYRKAGPVVRGAGGQSVQSPKLSFDDADDEVP